MMTSAVKPAAMIIDFDGTLYNSKARQERCFPPGGKKDFDRWNREASQDRPNGWCAGLIIGMQRLAYPIFVTGRDKEFYKEAELWLREYLDLQKPDYLLYMRPTGDYRKDCDLKREIYQTEIEPCWDVRFCVDDRRQVVEMWRSLGLVCLQCAEGEF